MKYLVYHDQIKQYYLVYDEDLKELNWERIKPEHKLDPKALLALITYSINNQIRRSPDDVEIIKVYKNNTIKKISDGTHITLSMGTRNLGSVLDEAREANNINLLKKYGGIVLSFQKLGSREIILIAPNPTTVNTKMPRQDSVYFSINKEESQRHDEDYIDAVLRIPSTINKNNYDLLKKILEINTELFRKTNDCAIKLDTLNSILVDGKSENTQILKSRVAYLEQERENLRADRLYLQKEIDKAESIAFNKIKENLRFSRSAIAKHVDLESFSSTRAKLESIIMESFSRVLSPEQIQSIMDSDFHTQKIRDFCDNVDSKIQSLLDIKKEFMSLKLLD